MTKHVTCARALDHPPCLVNESQVSRVKGSQDGCTKLPLQKCSRARMENWIKPIVSHILQRMLAIMLCNMQSPSTSHRRRRQCRRPIVSLDGQRSGMARAETTAARTITCATIAHLLSMTICQRTPICVGVATRSNPHCHASRLKLRKC